MKRMIAISLFILAFTLVGLGYYFSKEHYIASPHLGLEKFEKIEKGMSHDQVEAILGQPQLFIGSLGSDGIEKYYESSDDSPFYIETCQVWVSYEDGLVDRAGFEASRLGKPVSILGWLGWTNSTYSKVLK